ncbi:MAG: hypothetical protein ABFS46_04230 [Myxococcota bacterium]
MKNRLLRRLVALSGSLFGVLVAVAALANPPMAPEPEAPRSPRAHVREVRVLGSSGSYLLRVTVESPDAGCEQYANWWEVLTPDGKLLYRRILAHSHVDEQPFTRSGGPVSIDADQEVIVRAHMQPGGYGGVAFRGTPGTGFRRTELEPGFAAALAEEAPLPDSCDG